MAMTFFEWKFFSQGGGQKISTVNWRKEGLYSAIGIKNLVR